MKKLSISLFAVLAIMFAITSAFTSARLDYAPQSTFELFTAADLVDPGHTMGDEADIEAEIDAQNLVYRAAGNDLDATFDDFTYREHCIQATGDLCAVSVEWSTTGTSAAVVVEIEDFELGNFVEEL